MNELELTGRVRTHVAQRDDLNAALHHGAVEAFLAMHAAAARDGMQLSVFSAFRDFSAQASIWIRKYRGERPLYARDGTLRVHAELSQEELVEAILVWSALPGASRHHWGTDIDVYDARAMPSGYRIQLLPHEYAPGGVFGGLNAWLDENMVRFGFFRPYDEDRGGVLPEPWHLSYAPLAQPALRSLTPELIGAALREAQLPGMEIVLPRLESIHRRFVVNIAPPPAAVV